MLLSQYHNLDVQVFCDSFHFKSAFREIGGVLLRRTEPSILEADIEKGLGVGVPRQLQNTHYDGKDAKVKGQHYKYPHDYAHHWVKQQYLPDDVKNHKYYHYGDNKIEQANKEYWSKVKKEEK